MLALLSSGNATDYWEIKILENWLIEITWLWDYTNNYPPAIPFKDWKTTFTRKEFYFCNAVTLLNISRRRII